jgi:hypothetical protein
VLAFELFGEKGIVIIGEMRAWAVGIIEGGAERGLGKGVVAAKC